MTKASAAYLVSPTSGWVERRVWLWVTLIGVALMGLRTLTQEMPPAIVPDSSGYLDWSPVRTPGYPLFLLAVRAFDPDLKLLPFIMMALLIASCALLAQVASRLGGRWWIWTLFGATTLGNYFVWRQAWHVLTESLFMSLCMTLAACLAVAVRLKPQGVRWLVAAGLVLGITILVRPVGYALVATTLVVWFAWRGRGFPASAAFLAPAIAIVLAASSWNYATKGYFATQIFGGFNILPQVSLLISPEVMPDSLEARRASAEIANAVASVAARLPVDVASWQDYYWMTALAYNTSLYIYDLPIVSAEHGTFSEAAIAQRSCYWCIPVAEAKRMNAVAWSIARATIAAHPADYLRLVVVNFVALWTLPGVTSRAEADTIASRLQQPDIKAFYEQSDKVEVALEIPAAWVGAKNFLGIALMLGSFWLIIAFLLSARPSSLLTFGAALSGCLNAHHLLVALVEAGIFRYAMSMWPVLFAMVATMAALAVDAIAARSAQPRAGLDAG